MYVIGGTNSEANIDSNNINLITSATTSQLSGIYAGIGGTGTSNTVTLRGNKLKFNSTTMTSGILYAVYFYGNAKTQIVSGNMISGSSFGTSLSKDLSINQC